MAYDAVAQLESAGVLVADALTTEQRDVLTELTAHEVEMLTSIKERLAAAEDDLEPHALDKLEKLSGGWLF